MTASVVPPSIEYQLAFLAMLADFEERDPGNAEFYAPAKANFHAYVQSLKDEEHGIDLREGWVPCTHRWLVAPGGEVVGVARLRHNVDTPFLSAHGGHIGYDVAPGHRGQGYGHLALRAALVERRASAFPGSCCTPLRTTSLLGRLSSVRGVSLKQSHSRRSGTSNCVRIGSVCPAKPSRLIEFSVFPHVDSDQRRSS